MTFFFFCFVFSAAWVIVNDYASDCPTICGQNETKQTRIIECQRLNAKADDSFCTDTKSKTERICQETEVCRNMF